MAWDENGRYTVHGGVKLYSWVRANSPLSQELSRMGDRIEKVSYPSFASRSEDVKPDQPLRDP